MGDSTAPPAKSGSSSKTAAPQDNDGAGFEAITTQEAADAYVAAHLPADYTEALARAQDLEAQLAESKRALAVAEVAAATGVPAEAITGRTREEMEAAAAALLKWRQSSAPKPSAPPLRRPGLRSGASSPEPRMSPKARAAAALRRMRGQE